MSTILWQQEEMFTTHTDIIGDTV